MVQKIGDDSKIEMGIVLLSQLRILSWGENILLQRRKLHQKSKPLQNLKHKKIIPPTSTKQAEITTIPQVKKEVIVQNSPKTKRETLLKELFSVSYGDLMGLDMDTYKAAIAKSEGIGY